MISDDPDEDADSVDDDAVISGCLDIAAATSAALQSVSQPVEWPSESTTDMQLMVDPATMDWFRRQSGDHAARMNLILKGWINARTREPA